MDFRHQAVSDTPQQPIAAASRYLPFMNSKKNALTEGARCHEPPKDPGH